MQNTTTNKSTSPLPQKDSAAIFADRSTRLGIIALVVAVLIISALILTITLLSARTISETVTGQVREQQKLTVASLAGQIEGLFNNLANDLSGLAGRTELQRNDQGSRPAAITALTEVGSRRAPIIRGIVRLDRDGKPVYAFPSDYEQKIEAGVELPWTVDRAWVDGIVNAGRVQLTRVSASGGAAYLLSTTITSIVGVSNVIVIEIDIPSALQDSFKDFNPSPSSQFWVLDEFARIAYQLKPEPSLSTSVVQLLNINSTTLLEKFPTDEREAYVSPVRTAYSPSRASSGTFTLVLSRETAEGQREALGTLSTLLVIGLAVIALLLVFGLFFVRFQLAEANRRRSAESRRSTARTLLDVSRALNSSLEINVVLQQILAQLATILPYDGASIMLLDEDQKNIEVAAETGSYTPDMDRKVIPLNDVRGAREVLATRKPVVINDTVNDPRFTVVAGSNIRSWLGVPLRIRNESVGVLNIDSYAANRFQPDDIDLAEAFADQAGSAISSARAYEMQIKSYESELQTAQAIQTSLLPQESPRIPRLYVAARTLPARFVSGDYYQYFPLPDGKFALAVGDVSGKGIPAALLMAVITQALRDEILRYQSPAKLLNELNAKLLVRMQSTRMNSALTICVFDPLTKRAEVASGGMVQPYVRTPQGWQFVEVGGYPLGASSRTSYTAVTLTPISTMVFITDGVVEAINREGKLYGFDRFEELLNTMPDNLSSDEIADNIVASVKQYLDGVDAPDDITVVVVKTVTEPIEVIERVV